jgi:chitin disaccharide deacetylase
MIIILLPFLSFGQQLDTTYAERLGFPKGARVLILHVDDAGMSYASNEGAEKALTMGASTSVSVMMPCPWVPGFVQFLKSHPQIDAGLHLTLTSEWAEYRWGPLSGRQVVPGLTDGEGYLWSSVENVVKHASPDEVEKEMTAQLEKARLMGFEPTHLDTHMGTVYGSPEFLMAYIHLGIKNHIPVMLPGGADLLIEAQMHSSEATILQLRQLGVMLWKAGLPVLDDLHNTSYDWIIPADIAADEQKLDAFKTAKYIETLKTLKPGLTMMIMHCTDPGPSFKYISDSGPTRKGDLLAMLNPAFKKALIDQGIILTTWRELKQRRDKLN